MKLSCFNFRKRSGSPDNRRFVATQRMPSQSKKTEAQPRESANLIASQSKKHRNQSGIAIEAASQFGEASPKRHHNQSGITIKEASPTRHRNQSGIVKFTRHLNQRGIANFTRCHEICAAKPANTLRRERCGAQRGTEAALRDTGIIIPFALLPQSK